MRRVTPFLFLAGLVSAPVAGACPELSGVYRVVGSGADARDALAALGLGGLAPGSAIRFSGAAGGDVVLRATAPGGAVRSATLKAGTDYRCEGSQIVLRPVESTFRNDASESLSGATQVRIARGPEGGLSLSVSFQGSKRATLYAYDSAKVGVTVPGSGRVLQETLFWPQGAEAQGTPARAAEPAAVARVRAMLDDRVLGNVILGWASERGEAVAVTLKAPREKDAAALEERLRGAGIAYRVVVPPRWADGRYHMEILVQPGSRRASR